LLTTSAPAGASLGVEALPATDVTTVLHAAREALGGDASLDAVRAVKGVGRSDRVVGPVRMTGEVELRLSRADRYVRIERLLLGQLSAEIATGFNGRTLIQRARGPDGRRIDPPASPSPDSAAAVERSTLTTLRQDATLLWLGLFCGAFDPYPLRFGLAGSADSPEGKADVVDVTGDQGFAARLFIDERTHLPLFVSWSAPDVLAAGRAVRETRGAQGVPVDPATLLAQTPSVEHRLYFGDYRPVGSVRWPFRLLRSVGGQVSEELTIDRYTLNPADGAVFEPDR
jgi:hypothetical protein